MEDNKLKNIIVLKDLPSNLVDEAIVILKSNRRVNQKKIIKLSNNNEKILEDSNKKYAVQEAELLINEYIKKMDSESIDENGEILFKNKKIKIYSVAITCFFFISLIFNFV